MEKMMLRIFQSEAQKQNEFALTSAMYINGALKSSQNEKASTQLWYFAQNFLYLQLMYLNFYGDLKKESPYLENRYEKV